MESYPESPELHRAHTPHAVMVGGNKWMSINYYSLGIQILVPFKGAKR